MIGPARVIARNPRMANPQILRISRPRDGLLSTAASFRSGRRERRQAVASGGAGAILPSPAIAVQVYSAWRADRRTHPAPAGMECRLSYFARLSRPFTTFQKVVTLPGERG